MLELIARLYTMPRRVEPVQMSLRRFVTADSSVSSIIERQATDGDGRLPIDLAHAHKARADVIEMLTCQTPGKVMSHGMTAAGGSWKCIRSSPFIDNQLASTTQALGACNA